MANEPFKVAVRLADSLDTTVFAEFDFHISMVGVRIMNGSDKLEMRPDLLQGDNYVQSIRGIAEFTLVYTGVSGDYSLLFSISRDEFNSTVQSKVFHIDPAVVRLEFETIYDARTKFVGNDVLYPYPRVRLLDQFGALVNNSVLPLHIEMAPMSKEQQFLRTTGTLMQQPLEGQAIVEFSNVAIAIPFGKSDEFAARSEQLI